MKTEKAQTQMRKGMLDYCILLLLSCKPAYSSDIISQLKSADLIIVEGTLYPLLTRLKRNGLLSYEWQESLQGPPRKYYALTDKGHQVLHEMDEAWISLHTSVNQLRTQAENHLHNDSSINPNT